MKINKIVFLLVFLILSGTAFSQTVPFEKERYLLQKHVQYLASDELEGRATGTEGEMKAAAYISEQLQKLGVSPMGDKGSFLQPFEVMAGKYYGKNNSFQIHKETFEIDEAYYPLEYSGNGTVKGRLINVGHGVVTPDEYWNDFAGIKKLKNRIFIIEAGLPDKNNPHSEVNEFATLRNRIKLAEEKGAKAIIFVNSDSNTKDLVPDFQRNISPSSIPVIFAVDGEKVKRMDGKKAKLSVDLVEDKRTGQNVIGMIDNGSENTVIIGGHYDHLGFGEFGSRYLGKEKMIHNGADDNASGIAVMIEVARELSKADLDQNVLFIAFSGEEMGLLGSKYFVENPTIDLGKVSYMINMDMVGMMKNRTLIINGTGTSPAWGNLLVEASPSNWGIDITTNESGIGPSDHTSFYLKDIPVLALFTGTHDAYHKPEDDWEKLNYMGMHLISEFVVNLVKATEGDDKLAFTKTKDKQQEGGRRKFKVTLGVMPSYSHQGTGMKIDGVSEGKPAEKGGLKAGDIIVGIGKHEIKDIYGYMDALAAFKKGQTTTIKVERDGEIVELKVTF